MVTGASKFYTEIKEEAFTTTESLFFLIANLGLMAGIIGDGV